jgi:hypothetical protein
VSSHGGSSGGAAPATTVTGPDAFGDPAVVGTGLSYARDDHDHGLPASSGGGGGLLARVYYAPTSYNNNLSSSTSLVVVDPFNLTIPFTVPASGDVLVRLTGICLVPAATYGYWALFDHTSHAQVGDTALAGQSFTATVSIPFLITGLTPGANLQYDWAYACSSTAVYLPVQGAQGIPSGVNGGPAIMEVWAA